MTENQKEENAFQEKYIQQSELRNLRDVRGRKQRRPFSEEQTDF